MKGLVGITGRANSGKDVATNILKSGLLSSFSTYRFAGPLKQACSDMFGWTMEQIEDREFKETVDPTWGFKPRVAMQTLGTEWGRALREDLWVHMAQVKFDSPFVTGMIVSDVRFENEADFIRRNNGLLIHIHRPGEAIADNSHVSENGVEFKAGDAWVDNNSTIEEFKLKLERIVTGHFWNDKYLGSTHLKF